jgi:membrane-bound lytic murein transglycosylase MltF
VSLACATSGCGGRPANAPADAPPAATAPAAAADAPLPPPAHEAALPEGVRSHLFEKFTGDFDQMAARRLIRVGAPFNRTFYFVDNGVQRGAAYEFASYDAGPGRVRQLRKEAAKRGLDPNVWFGNVEQIASERIGRETVSYVSNIYKYYIAYRLLAEDRARREEAKAAIQSGAR